MNTPGPSKCCSREGRHRVCFPAQSAGRRRGPIFGQPDMFIASTAAEEGLTIVTRDTIHFTAAGVPFFGLWTG